MANWQLIFPFLFIVAGCQTLVVDLDQYRRNGGIEVSSTSGLFSGIMEKEQTNAWKTVELNRKGCRMELPESARMPDVPDWSGVSLYITHSRYPDARYVAQVIVKRISNDRYIEDLKREKEINAEWRIEGTRDRTQIDFWEWRHIAFHSILDVDKDGMLYRRDIRCPDGDVLIIEGMIKELLVETKTGKSLYPEMDMVIRRIINSIEPLNQKSDK